MRLQTILVTNSASLLLYAMTDSCFTSQLPFLLVGSESKKAELKVLPNQTTGVDVYITAWMAEKFETGKPSNRRCSSHIYLGPKFVIPARTSIAPDLESSLNVKHIIANTRSDPRVTTAMTATQDWENIFSSHVAWWTSDGQASMPKKKLAQRTDGRRPHCFEFVD